MKVTNEKDILYKTTNINHKCKEKEDFSTYIEDSIDQRAKNLLKEDSDLTSIYSERKVNKKQKDIFDTLINI